MALQKSIVINSGFTAANAYIKVDRFHGDKDIIRFNVDVFYDAAARNADKPALESYSYEIATPTSTDLITALYTYLKTLPEFTGAIDV